VTARLRLAPCLLLSIALLASGCGDAAGDSWTAQLWSRVASALGITGDGGADAPAPTATEQADEGGGALAAVQRALATATGGDEPEDTGPGYWRYTEPGGSVRFVQSLAEVPASLRDGAERIASAPQRSAAARPAPRPTLRRPAPAAAAEAPAASRGGDAEVVIYTTSWCPWCRKAVAWLDERGIAYENRDIERNPEWAAELHRKSGSGSVPVIDVGGELVRGFDQRALERLL